MVPDDNTADELGRKADAAQAKLLDAIAELAEYAGQHIDPGAARGAHDLAQALEIVSEL